MKKILIITPHFPPSNLAAVHRSRLFAQHLPSFGWEPIILTVHEDYYEEKLDHNLEKILPKGLRIEKVKALQTTKPRLVGDIGLRGFRSLYKRAKQIVQTETIDIVYIPIPSFYGALIGRMLHASTGVRYAIDYIDPWVHFFPGSQQVFSRHWFTTQLAKILEPIAVKHACLITGVAAGYYKGVQDRNPHLSKSCIFGAMPYGGEETDNLKVTQLNMEPYLFTRVPGVIKLVYAGAMLPKAYQPLEQIFVAIKKDKASFGLLQFHFIGTGKSPNDPQGFNIRPLAEKYGLWGSMVFEYPQRFPYLDVLVHLNAADGVFILGSTEPHYTPSKVYQGVLSQKPILAVLHQESSAVTVLKESGGGLVVAFNGVEGLAHIRENFASTLQQYLNWLPNFDPATINYAAFNDYSAKAVTRKLVDLLNVVVAEPGSFHSSNHKHAAVGPLQ